MDPACASRRAALFTAAENGVRLRVRLSPKASHSRILGVAAEADGGSALKVAVTAAPENGKANAALIRLLAKEWKLAKTTITLIAGATDRRKSLLINGDPAALLRRLKERLDHE